MAARLLVSDGPNLQRGLSSAPTRPIVTQEVVRTVRERQAIRHSGPAAQADEDGVIKQRRGTGRSEKSSKRSGLVSPRCPSVMKRNEVKAAAQRRAASLHLDEAPPRCFTARRSQPREK